MQRINKQTEIPLKSLSEDKLSLQTPYKKIINAITKKTMKPIVINLGGSGKG